MDETSFFHRQVPTRGLAFAPLQPFKVSSKTRHDSQWQCAVMQRGPTGSPYFKSESLPSQNALQAVPHQHEGSDIGTIPRHG
jgi:hypothetical protein